MRKPRVRQIGAFCPHASDGATAVLTGTLVGMSALKGRVVVWPTARIHVVPARPGHDGGLVAFALTAGKPGWRKPRSGEVAHG